MSELGCMSRPPKVVDGIVTLNGTVPFPLKEGETIPTAVSSFLKANQASYKFDSENQHLSFEWSVFPKTTMECCILYADFMTGLRTALQRSLGENTPVVFTI